MNSFTLIFLLFLVVSSIVEFWLSARQKAHVLNHRPAVPEAFKASIPLETHQKAADYTIEKNKFSNLESAIGIMFLLVLTLGGGIDTAFKLWADFDLAPMLKQLGAVGTLFLVMTVFEIPASFYQTFVIEEKYGFNKSTVGQFFKDQAMSLGLATIIGMPLFALILWVMDSVGDSWWIWAWAILISFSLLMSWLFPTVIAPLFNKFTPMEEGALEERIQTLLERCGFHSEGIFIMDGSKRSGHGNAYFTGLGNNKRIVFYDTLVNSLEDEELEAVLAHELGHFKCKHVIKMLVASSVISFISFAILGWLINEPWFYTGLGVAIEQKSNAAALMLFMLVSPVFSAFMQPISAYCSVPYWY